MSRPSRFLASVLALLVVVSVARGDAYDPPANYYATATGTGTTLKNQLHDIIDNHTVLSYDSARSSLQVTDAAPGQPGYMLSVYDRTAINVAAINPGGSIPGWDAGVTWNREHTWPQSRGVADTGPDTSDLFELRPAATASNGQRSNLNYGGAFGQPYGKVTDNGQQMWYPGDADAGMIARQEFYMAVRYDGSDPNTTNLELAAGNPATSVGLGDLNRLVEWNYAAPPDEFERKRNQIIYASYQHNRDPFTDHPEWVWSAFVGQNNDSRLQLAGGVQAADGSSALLLDLGRRLVGAPLPATQNVTLNKTGLNGTYYSVTTADAATSSVTGRYNAFRTNQTDARTIAVGLNASTATAGLKTGLVTIDNLDVTTGGGTGRGANDVNDTVAITMGVLDHANPSFQSGSDVNSLTYDFGTVTVGAAAPTFAFSIANLVATAGYTAALNLNSVAKAGDWSTLASDLSIFNASLPLAAGQSRSYTASLSTTTTGAFSATYTLGFVDENLPGAANLGTMTLTLSGIVVPGASADFDASGLVDGGDFLIWQRGFGSGGHLSTGDADGNGAVDAADLGVWQSRYGQASAAPIAATVAEPSAGALALLTLGLLCRKVARRVA